MHFYPLSYIRSFSSAVPQAAEFLDTQPLSKGKTEKKNKKKNADKASTSQLDSTGFITLPAPGSSFMPTSTPLSGSASPTMAGGNNRSPAPKPGFSRISSALVDTESPREGTPVAGANERGRLVIGLGKRKAGEMAEGTPPPKRR